MKRTLTLQRAAKAASWIAVGLCVLPLIAHADKAQPAPPQTTHLHTLLAVHDVRNAIHAPRIQPTDCAQSQPERGQ